MDTALQLKPKASSCCCRRCPTKSALVNAMQTVCGHQATTPHVTHFIIITIAIGNRRRRRRQWSISDRWDHSGTRPHMASQAGVILASKSTPVRNRVFNINYALCMPPRYGCDDQLGGALSHSLYLAREDCGIIGITRRNRARTHAQLVVVGLTHASQSNVYYVGQAIPLAMAILLQNLYNRIRAGDNPPETCKHNRAQAP